MRRVSCSSSRSNTRAPETRVSPTVLRAADVPTVLIRKKLPTCTMTISKRKSARILLCRLRIGMARSVFIGSVSGEKDSSARSRDWQQGTARPRASGKKSESRRRAAFGRDRRPQNHRKFPTTKRKAQRKPPYVAAANRHLHGEIEQQRTRPARPMTIAALACAPRNCPDMVEKQQLAYRPLLFVFAVSSSHEKCLLEAGFQSRLSKFPASHLWISDSRLRIAAKRTLSLIALRGAGRVIGQRGWLCVWPWAARWHRAGAP